MKRDELTRRMFLSNSLSVGAAVPLLALVGAAACKEEPPAQTPTPATTGSEPAAPAGPVCDMAKVPEAQVTARNALGYVEKSTMPDKNCANCLQYMADKGAGCSGCKLFAGPVAAEGYCNSWMAAS